MIELDLRSRTPIYKQVYEKIKRKIVKGDLCADEKLMSIRELSALLTINPNTIQKGYRQLEREGFIYSSPGRGFYVMELNAALIKEEKDTLKKDIKGIINKAKGIHMTWDEVVQVVDEVYEREVNHD